MIYTVLWKPAAEDELARIWNHSSNRNVVSKAANQIDILLRIDPQARGESRQGNRRILLVSPLGVDFEIIEADRMVWVLAVWRIKDVNGES